MSQFYDRFSEFIAQHKLLKNASTIIAAISGGVDSMVLLDLLFEHVKNSKVQIITVHLNHQLRGSAADEDEATVRQFCAKKNCPFISKKVNIREYANNRKLSLEMAGREVRYTLFSEIAKDYPKALIATAHTADDQLETVLFRILKGTGLNGLQGIQIKRENIIRPLLFASKAEIYQYAKEHSVPYHEDYTNQDTSIPRNYIRQTLIPAIKSKINPALEKSIFQLSSIASDASRFLTDAGMKAYKRCLIYQTTTEIALDISRLKRYFTSVKFEVIRECINQLNPQFASLDFIMMENILKLVETSQTGSQLPLTDNFGLFIDRNTLIFTNRIGHSWDAIAIIPGKRYTTAFFDFQTEVQDSITNPPDKENRNIEYVDLDKLGNSLRLRPWQESDKITPLGSTFTKKISDIFIDQKVPLLKKNRVPILVSDQSIVWVCGYKLSDNFKVDSATQKMLKLIYKENNI